MGVQVPPSAGIFHEPLKCGSFFMQSLRTGTTRILPIFLSGYPCAFRCIYCNAAASTGQNTPFQPADIHRMIDEWPDLRSPGFKEVAFYGNDPRSFHPDQFLALLAASATFYFRGDISGVRLSMRPDTALEFTDFKSFGIHVVELGVQSMDAHILRTVHRGHDRNQVVQACRHLRNHQVGIGIQTMTGLPGADESEALFTAHQVAAIHPDFVRIHPTLVLRDTPLAVLYEKGIYAPWPLDRAVSVCADVVRIYQSYGIRVARCGFHIPDHLIRDVLADGPYHPAFGALVKGEIRYQSARTLLRQNPSLCTITVPPDELSDYLGHRRRNLIRLRNEFNRPVTFAPERKKGCSQ